MQDSATTWQFTLTKIWAGLVLSFLAASDKSNKEIKCKREVLTTATILVYGVVKLSLRTTATRTHYVTMATGRDPVGLGFQTMYSSRWHQIRPVNIAQLRSLFRVWNPNLNAQCDTNKRGGLYAFFQVGFSRNCRYTIFSCIANSLNKTTVLLCNHNPNFL